MALHHFPNHAKTITEICRVSRDVLFVDVMNPLLVRILIKIGFLGEEGCGITTNRLDGKSVENMLKNHKLQADITYFFVVPVYTYNPFLIRCLISFFELTNQLINKSKSAGLLCGNVAIIRWSLT